MSNGPFNVSFNSRLTNAEMTGRDYYERVTVPGLRKGTKKGNEERERRKGTKKLSIIVFAGYWSVGHWRLTEFGFSKKSSENEEGPS
jgi:hypothetical protein